MSDKAQTTTVASGKRRQFLVDSARLACGVGLLGVGMGFYAEHAKALPPAALRPPRRTAGKRACRGLHPLRPVRARLPL